MLFDTIASNFVRHTANQRYFARAIKECKPVYKTLDEEIGKLVIVRTVGGDHA